MKERRYHHTSQTLSLLIRDHVLFICAAVARCWHTSVLDLNFDNSDIVNHLVMIVITIGAPNTRRSRGEESRTSPVCKCQGVVALGLPRVLGSLEARSSCFTIALPLILPHSWGFPRPRALLKKVTCVLGGRRESEVWSSQMFCSVYNFVYRLLLAKVILPRWLFFHRYTQSTLRGYTS